MICIYIIYIYIIYIIYIYIYNIYDIYNIYIYIYFIVMASYQILELDTRCGLQAIKVIIGKAHIFHNFAYMLFL